MNILINVLLGFYILIALLMILVILMQRPKSEGLGAAFGGGMTENLFGAQTTNVLTKFTGWLAGSFFILSFLLSILYAHRSGGDSNLRRDLMQGQPPATTAAGSPAAKPGPSSAVGAPGTVTNPVPAGAAAAPSANPADLAVGNVPAGPQTVATPTPAAPSTPAATVPATPPKP